MDWLRDVPPTELLLGVLALLVIAIGVDLSQKASQVFHAVKAVQREIADLHEALERRWVEDDDDAELL